MYNSNLRDFVKEAILKDTLEQTMYQKAGNNYGISGDSLVVAGPDIIRHISNVRRYISTNKNDKVTIVDINKEVVEFQKKTINKLYSSGERVPTWPSLSANVKGMPEMEEVCDIGHNVFLANCDIAKIRPTKFVDADLMSTQFSCGNSIIKALQNQRAEFPVGSGLKGFIFTISVRNGGGLLGNLHWVLSKLVPKTGATAKIGNKHTVTINSATKISTRNFKGVSVTKYDFMESSDESILHDMSVFQYNDDGGPMLTGILLYD